MVCRSQGKEFTCSGIVPVCPFVCDGCRPCTNCPPKPGPTPKPKPGGTPTPTPPPPPPPPPPTPVVDTSFYLRRVDITVNPGETASFELRRAASSDVIDHCVASPPSGPDVRINGGSDILFYDFCPGGCSCANKGSYSFTCWGRSGTHDSQSGSVGVIGC